MPYFYIEQSSPHIPDNTLLIQLSVTGRRYQYLFGSLVVNQEYQVRRLLTSVPQLFVNIEYVRITRIVGSNRRLRKSIVNAGRPEEVLLRNGNSQ